MTRIFMPSIAFLSIRYIAMEYDQLLKRMDSHTQLLKEILEQLKCMGAGSLVHTTPPDLSQELIDNVDVKSILKISHSTLQRIRKNKLITPIRIGTRDYYSLAEIKGLVNRFMK